MSARLDYRELRVWQKGMDLVVAIYELTRLLPVDERYGLVAQMRRAAVSIPANIAEGHGRAHRGDYMHHVSVANGSVREVATHLEICVRLRYLTESAIAEARLLMEELGRMLSGLVARLRSPAPRSPLAR